MRKHIIGLLCIFGGFLEGAECQFPSDLIVSSEEISRKIQETGDRITQDYQDKDLVIVMVMKGSLCVVADLIRQIDIPFTLESVRASSYGANGMTGGALRITDIEGLSLKGKDVLIIDDIFETGNTLRGVYSAIRELEPASVRTLVLLVKEIASPADCRPDYVLFDIPDRFVVGYGLDYKERYRGLADIRAFPENKAPF